MAALFGVITLICFMAVVPGADRAPDEAKKLPVEAAKFLTLRDDVGLTYVKNTFNNRSDEAYKSVYKYTESAGCSNLFLVHGKDFEAALLDTERVLFARQSANPMYIPADANCWLFVSLGAGLWWKRGVGPASVDRGERLITFEYDSESEWEGAWRGYAYWVPLGRLKVGEYTLKLMPKGERSPTLTRFVTLRDL